MTGLLFMAAAWLYPPLTQPIDLIFSLVFISLLIAIFFIDLEDQVIPDSLSVTGIAAGLLFNLIKGPLNYFISALAGMVVAYLLFFLIAALGKRMFKKEAMGEGDLFLATYTAKALARPLGHPEYDAIGYAALDRGKLVFALEAFKRSENQAMIGTLVDQQQKQEPVEPADATVPTDAPNE